jgi:hypothetical protein
MKTAKLLNLNRGFSTFELLIAFTIMTLSIVAVIMVAFGNQAIAIDTELSHSGLYISQKLLEETITTLKQDFNSISTQATASAYNAIYDTQISITDISPCVKEITSSVLWNKNILNKQTSLVSLAVSPTISSALGNDCETHGSNEVWDNPTPLSESEPIDFGSIGTDIDVVENGTNRFVILTTKWTSGQNTLSIINADDPLLASPTIIGGIEAADKLNFNAVDAYAASDTNSIFVFVASASTTASLQIYHIDVSDPLNATVTLLSKARLPQTNTAVARSVYYYDGKVYLGTQYLACPASCALSQNNEFHIFDVSVPHTPLWQGSVNVNHNVNDIEVLGDLAYLAVSDNDRELVVLSINPAKSDYLTHHDISNYGYNAPGNEDALTVAVSGQYAFIGRRRSKDFADFFALEVRALSDGANSNDGVESSADLDNINCTYQAETITQKKCLGTNTLINDITLRGPLAFLATTQAEAEFQIWDISEPKSIKPKIKCNAMSLSGIPVAADFSDDYGYLALESNNALAVIYDDSTKICLP